MRHFSIAPVLAAVLATSAAAQTPAQRTLVEAFRDSIGRSVDTVALGRLERGAVQRVRGNRGTPAKHLRLGYLALRLAELGRASGYDDAASEFQWVARVEPGWALGWYGLGLAHDALGAHEAAGEALAEAARLQPMNGQSWYALGMAHHHCHRPERVKEVVEHIVRFDPRMARQLIREAERADLAHLVAHLEDL